MLLNSEIIKIKRVKKKEEIKTECLSNENSKFCLFFFNKSETLNLSNNFTIGNRNVIRISKLKDNITKYWKKENLYLDENRSVSKILLRLFIVNMLSK